ncbi:hypothetical protein EJ06DRAFT_582937, partial [Trichodelitschia bisporula]
MPSTVSATAREIPLPESAPGSTIVTYTTATSTIATSGTITARALARVDTSTLFTTITEARTTARDLRTLLRRTPASQLATDPALTDAVKACRTAQRDLSALEPVLAEVTLALERFDNGLCGEEEGKGVPERAEVAVAENALTWRPFHPTITDARGSAHRLTTLLCHTPASQVTTNPAFAEIVITCRMAQRGLLALEPVLAEVTRALKIYDGEEEDLVPFFKRSFGKDQQEAVPLNDTAGRPPKPIVSYQPTISSHDNRPVRARSTISASAREIPLPESARGSTLLTRTTVTTTFVPDFALSTTITEAGLSARHLRSLLRRTPASQLATDPVLARAVKACRTARRDLFALELVLGTRGTGVGAEVNVALEKYWSALRGE